MSVKVMGWVWDLDIPANEKFVLLAYADHADHDGTSIHPAVKTVAKKTGYSERQVQTITRDLQSDGLLVPDGRGPKGTNKWRIPIPPRVGGEESAPPPVGGELDDIEGVKNMDERVQFEAERGEVATAPDSSVNHPTTEPSFEPSTAAAPTKAHLVRELTLRGISERTAADLIHAQPPVNIDRYVRYYDSLQPPNRKTVGWLVQAIRDGYELPAGFLKHELAEDRSRYTSGQYAEFIEH